MTTHPVAIEFYNWIQDMAVADESFFPTLLRITKVKQVDGEWRVTQNLKAKGDKHLCSRTSLWELDGYKCYGEHINEVCNVAVPDLRYLREKGCFIGNKFNLEVAATAVLCQLKELVDKNLEIQKDNKKYYNKIF